jgi:hypothetical protein
LRGLKGENVLGYDAVLVMIGSIPPHEALRAAGVRTIGDADALGISTQGTQGRQDTKTQKNG